MSGAVKSIPIIFLGIALRKYELYRDFGCGKQQPLWQKQVTIIGSIDSEPRTNEYQTGVV